MALPEIGLQAVMVLQQFESNARKYDSELKKLEQQTDKTAKRITASTTKAGAASSQLATGAKQAADAQEAAAASSELFSMKLGLAVGAAIAVATAVAKATIELYRLSEASAETVDARQSFVALAASSGIAADQLLADLQRVSRGTVDSSTLIQTANRALLAGGAQIADQLPRLYQIAEAAARATGQNTNYVFETLVKGIVKASPMLIDNAEVYIKVGSAVDDYAASLGKTAEQLSVQERQFAILNAVTEQGGEFIERTGGKVEATTDAFRQSDVAIKEFGRGIGEVALPAMQYLSGSLVAWIQQAKVFVSTLVGMKAALDAVFAGAPMQAMEAFQVNFDRVFTTLSGGIPDAEQAAVAIEGIGAAADEAAKDTSELNDKLADLATQRTGKLEDIERQFSERWEDILIQRARQIEDAELSLYRQREDMARQAALALEDIERDRARTRSDIERDQARKVTEFMAEANRSREDLERRHQERLQQIQLRYTDTIQEAARRNDAVAIAQAIRTKQRELRDAETARQTEQADLGRDLEEKRQQIEQDAIEARQREQERYNQAIEDLRISQQRQEQELQISLSRQEQDRQIAWQRQVEDLERAKARQLEALSRWYAEELEKLDVHLAGMGQSAANRVSEAGAAIAQAASEAVVQIATATMGAMAGAGAGMITPGGLGAGAGAVLGTPTNTALDQWLRGSTPGGYRAEGGLDVVSQPTTFMMGEAGPEAVLSVPLSGQMNVNHRFSKLPVGFDGLPGGVNTGQVESLIWDIFSQVGKNLLQQRAQI
jgi:hypothetical protein